MSSKKSSKKNNQKSSRKSQKTSFRGPLLEEKRNFITSNNKYIPSYDIINGPAFGSVVMNLEKDQIVVTQYGCMSYMDGHIATKTESRGGILKGLKRMFLTSSSMFMTHYKGTQQKKNKITFAGALPGDILPLRIRPNEKVVISPMSLICFTDNLIIESKRRLRGLLTSEGIYQTEFINKSSSDGMVWLSAYGGYNKIILKEGESIKLDNGLFLCSQTKVKYSISMLGGIKTSFLSGEGLLMHFQGPCELYMQGRSIHSLLGFVGRHITISRKGGPSMDFALD